ncbi:hypothetical protein DOTSEDRAFT_19356 [Dothistroma septosporum NZE10]|uniref:F-box domain-containing protein n=1 Tax=Dothistroma septosporum (strain NZE10 / CBS 128990) TaxID=675120 RepID=N1PZJ1_DOTSN|nr:hypothetical protein DOTSEDRAFT_19356 [Dothistroma septosporum NZE10]
MPNLWFHNSDASEHDQLCPCTQHHAQLRRGIQTSTMLNRDRMRENLAKARATVRDSVKTCLRRNFTVRKTRDPGKAFALFLDLPAEIRERVYELCADNDRSILEEHFTSAKPPPELAVACASRQLRREALPIFYRHYRFPVTFSSGDWINKGCLPPSMEWKAARWYHRLEPEKLRMIRRLELYYCFGRFQLDFDARSNGYEVRQTAWGSRRMVDVSPVEEKKQLLALLRSVVDDVLKEAGVGMLAAKDFDHLEWEVLPNTAYHRKAV